MNSEQTMTNVKKFIGDIWCPDRQTSLHNRMECYRTFCDFRKWTLCCYCPKPKYMRIWPRSLGACSSKFSLSKNRRDFKNGYFFGNTQIPSWYLLSEINYFKKKIVGPKISFQGQPVGLQSTKFLRPCTKLLSNIWKNFFKTIWHNLPSAQCFSLKIPPPYIVQHSRLIT